MSFGKYTKNTKTTKTERFHAPMTLLRGNEAIPKQYYTAAFIGYNHATLEDARRLTDFVSRGGRPIHTRAHLTSTTDFEDIRGYRPEEASDTVSKCLSGNARSYNISKQSGCLDQASDFHKIY